MAPSWPTVSRMLLSIMFMNTDSNWLATFLSDWSGLSRALRFKSDSARASSANELSMELVGLLMVKSDNFQFGAQRAGGLHGLQNGQQVLGGGPKRVERLHYLGQLGAGLHHHQVAAVLADLDVGFFGDHGLPARGQRGGLADDRGALDAHRQ